MVSVTHHKKKDLKPIENTLHRRNEMHEKEMKTSETNLKTPMPDKMKSPEKSMETIKVMKNGLENRRCWNGDSSRSSVPYRLEMYY